MIPKVQHAAAKSNRLASFPERGRALVSRGGISPCAPCMAAMLHCSAA
ncbi:hypothetical protein C882_0154 [Caenispirillum salinarum AK4]|uniref:Uncharacterized protein n=1 Tax=Caenispirillum salinarum AK4 TaxID=1238182 RepID=K9HI51_9PROT|nr:hypothetical protein C882_0154 [Caenispirillum salinarum AK4]